MFSSESLRQGRPEALPRACNMSIRKGFEVSTNTSNMSGFRWFLLFYGLEDLAPGPKSCRQIKTGKNVALLCKPVEGWECLVCFQED